MTYNPAIFNAQKIKENADVFAEHLVWLEHFIWARAEFGKQSKNVNTHFLLEHKPPTLPHQSTLREILQEGITQNTQELVNIAERLILVLALVPHVRPHLLDIFFFQNEHNRIFTEFGGVNGTHHRGFLPTGETAMYLLAGNNLELRFLFQQIFSSEHYFYKKNVLRLENSPTNEPPLSGQIIVSEKYLHLLTTAQEYKPQFSAEFPATRLETSLTWDDLVLNHDTQVSILEVRAWLRQYKKIMEHPIFGREAHGYKCLLHGEPGTGKTLTVKLLGKEIGADIYRIDLSKIVSKYIGETEKNLHKIFEMAKYQDWVLFFDEGDALFGKRSEAKSSNDRYANQETAFLLQKMEEHQGILILATNIRTNLDKAFLRRFQSDIYFGLPDENARLQLWEKAFAQYLQLEEGIDLHETSRKFSFTGANIHNIRQQCAVLAFDRGNNIVTKDDFQEAIKKQLQKDGKTM
jgi:hypothetical protein